MPPIKLPQDWEHVRTYRLDTTRDDERDWVVLYRFDLASEAEHDLVPIGGAVYQPTENDADPIRYDLLPRNDEYLCECECIATMDNVLSGLPGSELVVSDFCNKKLTRVSVFHWESAASGYVPTGHFSGSRIEIGQDELTVYQRVPHRAQLAFRQVYRPRDNKTYYPPGDLGDPVMAARYEYTFYDSEPKDVTQSPYPEKVILAFYSHYGDRKRMSKYITQQAWKEVEQCQSGQCGCLAPPDEIAHVWITDLQSGEYTSSDRASFDLTIMCERADSLLGQVLEPEMSIRWNLVQEDGRWKLELPEPTSVE
jgi:hypothetical protein